MALANVVDHPIMSIYPCVNGVKDFYFTQFNTSLNPINTQSSRQTLKVLWTSVFPPSPDREWFPNHFVPLLPPERSYTPPTPTPTPIYVPQSPPNATDRRPILPLKQIYKPPTPTPTNNPQSPPTQRNATERRQKKTEIAE